MGDMYYNMRADLCTSREIAVEGASPRLARGTVTVRVA